MLQALLTRCRKKLPTRVRCALDARQVYRCTRAVESLPPLPIATENLRAEVHVLLGRLFVAQVLPALRTFYHHSGLADRVGLTIHTDGTVTPRQKGYLARHLRGVRFIDYPCAEPRLRELFHHRPVSQRFYHGGVACPCLTKLFQPAALARCPRAILMDSDVVWYSRPQTVIDWVDAAEEPAPRYLLAPRGSAGPAPQVHEAFEQIRRRLLPIAPQFNIQDHYLNAGFLMLSLPRVNFDLVESFFAWYAQQTSYAPGFWFNAWTLEQTSYLLNYSTWPDAAPLDQDYVCGDGPAKVLSHFTSQAYMRPASLARIATAVEAIVPRR